MSEPTKYVAEHLQRAEGAPTLDPKAHKERLAFLREYPDLQSVGFNLRTGMVSQTFPLITFGRWEQPEGLEADTDLGVLRSLHERAVGTWRGMAQSLQDISDDDDPALNDAGRLKTAAEVIKPKLDELQAVAESELARVDQAIAQEEAAVAASLRPADPALAALHSDIRAHWKATKAEERSGLMLGILQGTIDDDTLTAIATAPGYMTGISADLHDKARALLAKRLAPERVKRIDALRVGKARALQALTGLQRTAGQLIDFKKAAQLAEKSRRHR